MGGESCQVLQARYCDEVSIFFSSALLHRVARHPRRTPRILYERSAKEECDGRVATALFFFKSTVISANIPHESDNPDLRRRLEPIPLPAAAGDRSGRGPRYSDDHPSDDIQPAKHSRDAGEVHSVPPRVVAADQSEPQPGHPRREARAM